MMIAAGSTYFLLASVVVGAMALLGLGVLFARASNIERPNLVGGITLVFAALSALVLWAGGQFGLSYSDRVAWGAISLSIFGFLAARVLDYVLGARSLVHHDDATLDADLAD
jgi:hypothetical protein